MNSKKIRLDLFSLSVYINIIYAFLPIVRCLPYEIRLLWRVAPAVLVLISIFIKSNSRVMVKGLAILVFAVFLAVIRYSGNANGTEGGILGVIVNSVLYWTAMIQGYYAMQYLNPRNGIKMLRMTVALIVVSTFTTIIGNIVVPGASRAIMHFEEQSVYYIRNIGGYGFIYGLAMFAPYFWYLFIEDRVVFKQENKVVVVIACALSGISVLMSNYATAIGVFAVGFIAYGRSRRTKRFLCGFVLAAALVVLFNDVLLSMLEQISLILHNAGNDVLYERVHGIHNYLKYRATYGDVAARVSLYKTSWDHFVRNPLFGLMGELGVLNRQNVTPANLILEGLGKEISVGRHSDLLDLLGAGGLFAVIPFFIVINKYRKEIMRRIDEGILMKCFIVGLLQFFVYAVADHAFSNFEVSMVTFLVPALIIASRKSYNRE